MKIDIETAKKYLTNPKQAILDAQNSVFTELDLQSAIDDLIESITPKLNKGNIFLERSYPMDAVDIITAQNNLDEKIKPFIRKMNKELNWKIRTPADIMK